MRSIGVSKSAKSHCRRTRRDVNDGERAVAIGGARVDTSAQWYGVMCLLVGLEVLRGKMAVVCEAAVLELDCAEEWFLNGDMSDVLSLVDADVN